MKGLKVGDVVLVEYNRKPGFYEARILREAEVSEQDKDMGKQMFQVEPLKRFFNRWRWIRSYSVVGVVSRNEDSHGN